MRQTAESNRLLMVLIRSKMHRQNGLQLLGTASVQYKIGDDTKLMKAHQQALLLFPKK